MLFHPYTLQLLHKFKTSISHDIPKELLCLLLEYKSYIDLDLLYEYLFLHKDNAKSKYECMKILKSSIKSYFNYLCIKNKKEFMRLQRKVNGSLVFKAIEESENKDDKTTNSPNNKINEKYDNKIKDFQKHMKNDNCFFVAKDDIGLSKEYFNILNQIESDFIASKKKRTKISSFFYLRQIEEEDKNPKDVVKRKEINGDIEDSDYEGLILRLSERFIDDKKKYKSFLNSLKNKISSKEYKENLKDVNEPKRVKPRDSLLSFVTKEKISMPKYNLFTPINFEDNVYVYKINNPNYTSLRMRKDLIKPTKKIYINFTFESRPSLYTIPENRIKCKNSLKTLMSVDYDEESTWEDDLDGEVINSDDSEEDEESSGIEEWIEEDSCSEETKKLKKPVLAYPNIKIEYNSNYESIFMQLPLTYVDHVPSFLLDKLDEGIDVKEISRRYLVHEAAILRYVKKE